MTERIVELTRDDVRLVVKQARDEDEAALLLREAALLEAASHPGVVEVVASEHAGPTPALTMRCVGGPVLAGCEALSVEEAGGVAAGVASTLADLHGLGIVHGAVAPEHVLIAPDGRPVLCGFGHGSRIGEAPPAAAVLPDGFHDPSRSPDDPLFPSADVFGLGAVLRWLIQACEAPWDVGALGRSGPSPGLARLRSRGDAGRCILRLRALAARATAADPSRRPTARELAAAIRDAVPGSRLPTRDQVETSSAPTATIGEGALGRLRANRASGRDRARRTPSGSRRRRMVTVSVGALLAVGAVLVGGRLADGGGRASKTATPDPAPEWSRSDDSDRGATPPAAGLERVETGEPSGAPAEPAPGGAGPGTGASRCPTMTALLAADVDGDGCPEALRYTDGTLEAGTARWAVGQPGDQVAAADWACSGSSTLALLRPDTGEVFVFAGWALSGHDLVADRAGRVPGGFALRSADLDGDACAELVVERPDGPPAPVTIPSGPCIATQEPACPPAGP